MAISASTMSSSGGDDGSKVDGHEHDLVMPGFRFHPTEEELIEFYLRRKVEGRRFNVELITFLDLYRHDPWELPALAAIGEKEWYFYVPRDRKYRNGDRPNRVTRSGYWKATGADRMIRAESSRPIGLKKTLVFYSGKAPKGVRSSWIMNEYRLPQSETDRYRRAELSLCRVYKRAEDPCRHPPALHSSIPSSSTAAAKTQNAAHHNRPSFEPLGDDSSSSQMDRILEAGCSSKSTSDLDMPTPARFPPLDSNAPLQEVNPILHHSKACTVDELSGMVGYSQSCCYLNQAEPMLALPQPRLLPLNALPSLLPPTMSEKLWEWNPLSENQKDYSEDFK